MLNIRNSLVAVTALGALGLASAVGATPIGYEYNGICIDGPAPEEERLFNCGSIGLESGDPVFGFMEVDSSAFDDFVLTGAEIQDSGFFYFVFGDAFYDSSDSILFGSLFLDDSFNVAGGILGVGRSVVDFAISVTFTPNGGGLWGVRTGEFGAGGIGRYSPITVPEPGTLALLGLGLLGLAFARRVRRV